MAKLPIILLAGLIALLAGCDIQSAPEPRSTSGVTKASTTVQTGSDGLTVEQRNIKDRLAEDNKPGSIKHLYVISPYSGQVILYSTVRGKVTSGSKRLTPIGVAVQDGQYVDSAFGGFSVGFPAGTKRTGEVLQDDGTYGSSGDYLYWWDTQGRYHQHYLTGGQIVHVSGEPMPVKSVIISTEVVQ